MEICWILEYVYPLRKGLYGYRMQHANMLMLYTISHSYPIDVRGKLCFVMSSLKLNIVTQPIHMNQQKRIQEIC